LVAEHPVLPLFPIKPPDVELRPSVFDHDGRDPSVFNDFRHELLLLQIVKERSERAENEKALFE
jgi:hypothetical protein